MALFYALTSKHLLPEKRERGGRGEKRALFDDKFTTRHTLFIVSRSRDRRVETAAAHLIGAQISWQDSFDDSAPLSCPQTHT